VGRKGHASVGWIAAARQTRGVGMWIKWTLIVAPLALVAVLLGSVMWVPRAGEVTREDRIVLTLTDTPASMNPWFSNSANDQDVYTYIFEGLLAGDGNFKLYPRLAETVRVGEEIEIILSPGDDEAALKQALKAEYSKTHPGTFKGFVDYSFRNFDSSEQAFGHRMANDPMDGKPAAAPDSAKRLVLRFEAPAKKPDGSDWDKKDMPSTVVTDARERIETVMATEPVSKKAYVTGFKQLEQAFDWYITKYKVSEKDLGLSAKPSPAPKDEDTEKLIKEVGPKITAAARKNDQDAPEFGEYYATFPSTRIVEHPVISIWLRKGVKWHDYETSHRMLDVEDVLFTYQFARHPDVHTESKSYVEQMQQMRIFGSHRFDIVYSQLSSPAMGHLDYAKIIPKHKFSKEEWTRQAVAKGRGPTYPDDPTYNYRTALPPAELEFSLAPVGTGPLRMFPLNGDSKPMWRSGEMVRLERFDDYWNVENIPLFKYLDFMIIDPDLGAETAESVFRSGGLDIFGIRPHQVKKYETMRDKYYIYKRPNLNYYYIGLNLENPILSDKKVRQALALATDVQGIMDAVIYGQGARVSGPQKPILPYYDDKYIPSYTFRQGANKGKTIEAAGMKYYPFDMAEAKALLAEAGWTQGANGKLSKGGEPLKFKLIYGGIQSSSAGKIGTLAVEKWKELGCDIQIEELDFNVFIAERVMPRRFDAMVLGWDGGIDFDEKKLWHSESFSPNGYNFTGFKNPASDKLMEDITRVYDQDEIVNTAHKVFRSIAEELPYIFLFTIYSNLAIDRHLYWAKPVLGADGKFTHVDRSQVDDELMDLKYGPRTNITQWKRDNQVKFPANPKERRFVASPGTWGDAAGAGGGFGDAAAKK
jgi:peptide/nickel transport system substrate-binding protein